MKYLISKTIPSLQFSIFLNQFFTQIREMVNASILPVAIKRMTNMTR